MTIQEAIVAGYIPYPFRRKMKVGDTFPAKQPARVIPEPEDKPYEIELTAQSEDDLTLLRNMGYSIDA